MKKVLTLFMGLTMFLGLSLGSATIAQAQSPTPKPVVTPGMKLDSGADPYNCSLGVVGKDKFGNVVGITAGHCTSSVGQPFFYPGQRNLGPIGNVAYRASQGEQDTGKDYAVIKYDTSKVSVNPVGQGVSATSIGGVPRFGANLTKKGSTTGVTYGPYVNRNPNGNLNTWVIAGPGDSGGVLVQGTAWVGLVRGFYIGFGPFVYTSAQTVLADLNPRNVVGSGFVPAAG